MSGRRARLLQDFLENRISNLQPGLFSDMIELAISRKRRELGETLRKSGPEVISRKVTRACSHYSQSFDDEREAEEREEEDIEFFKS
jgi:hypothetical protein